MSGRNHGINANIEILVIPVNLPVGNGDIPTLILWQQRIKIGLIPNGISFQMFKVLHMFAPRGYAFFVPLGAGERPFGFTPTFTGHGYYSKKQPRSCSAVSGFEFQTLVLRQCGYGCPIKRTFRDCDLPDNHIVNAKILVNEHVAKPGKASPIHFGMPNAIIIWNVLDCLPDNFAIADNGILGLAVVKEILSRIPTMYSAIASIAMTM